MSLSTIKALIRPVPLTLSSGSHVLLQPHTLPLILLSLKQSPFPPSSTPPPSQSVIEHKIEHVQQQVESHGCVRFWTRARRDCEEKKK